MMYWLAINREPVQLRISNLIYFIPLRLRNYWML